MPSPTDDPLISTRPTNHTYGCLVGPVQFALGSNKRARPTIPTSTTSFVLGTTAAANVQCRARRHTLWVQDKRSRSKQTKTHGAVLLQASGQLKGGTLVSLPGYFSHSKWRAVAPTEHAAADPLMTSRLVAR